MVVAVVVHGGVVVVVEFVLDHLRPRHVSKAVATVVIPKTATNVEMTTFLCCSEYFQYYPALTTNDADSEASTTW